MTVLGFDYGEKRIGVAIGSTDTGLAEPLLTLVNSDRLFLNIAGLLAVHHPSQLVIGISERISARQADVFTRRLAKETSLQTDLVDETLSTKEAQELIRHQRRRRKKQTLHAAAAAVILERWLADHKSSSAMSEDLP